MSWGIFRAQFKDGFNNQKDMSVVISDAYDTCVKTGKGGSTQVPAKGTKAGLRTMLKACFASYGTVPFESSLDTGLKLYWVGGTAGADLATPGLTAGFIKQENKELDGFIDQLIDAFDNYHKQIVFTLPATPPVVTVGYKVDSETEE